MDKYADFMSQIPAEIMQRVEKRFSTDVAIFKPHTYISGIEMRSSDYHVILPSIPPPSTYINHKLFRFDSKNIIMFNPDDSILCTGEQPTKQYLNVLIKPELINRIAAEMELSGEVRFMNAQNSLSADLIHSIHSFERETARPDSFTLMLDCMGVRLAALLLREFKTNLKKYPAHSPDMDAHILIAIEFMREFFGADISIEDICREINVSVFHFIRVFKEKTGLSPHQYLLGVRIEKAQELLRSRRYSVSETGRMCGFVNLSHFSKTFKEMTGKSPREYLKRYYTF